VNNIPSDKRAILGQYANINLEVDERFSSRKKIEKFPREVKICLT
jgi:hypothetical protein